MPRARGLEAGQAHPLSAVGRCVVGAGGVCEHHKAEIRIWAPMIKAANIKTD